METKKRIRISIKRKKPAGSPAASTGRKPRASREPAGKLQEVSPVLTDMLQKLAGWTPHSNNGVLEVANRLAQAAMEEIDKETVKKARKDSSEYALGLLYHTLSYWNGVSTEYSLVIGVEHDRANSSIRFKMLTVFNHNRIGTPAILCTVREYPVSDIHPPIKGQRNEVCIAGKYYLVDGPLAMATIMAEVLRYKEELDWLNDNSKVGRLKKLWDASKKLTRSASRT